MRIATFNINGINKRLQNLLDWLENSRPDVVCLQETKTIDARFPAAVLEAAGYTAVWTGESRWNGVAILARGREIFPTRRRLPGDPDDRQARYVEAAIGGIVVASIYAPNGNPRPGPKFDYKLAWLARLKDHATGLLDAGVPVVLAGDYNVAPGTEDIYATRSYDDNALIQPEARSSFADLLACGYTDTVRALNPGVRLYTFWDYRQQRWARDAGLRLDHVLVDDASVQSMVSASVDRQVRGRGNASDHAPVVVEMQPRILASREALERTEGAKPD